ncbi:hypothetical protein LAWI1_G007021, partial [Lachnellula willkommii]
HMHEPAKRQELMRAGLRKSCEYIRGILEREIRDVGRENVVLWGLSQGCATSLTSLLTWDGEPFAATIGMCEYLPFANHIEDIARGSNSDAEDLFGNGDDDPLSHSGDEEDEGCIFGRQDSVSQDRPTQAVAFLRDEIEIEGENRMVFQEIPVFLGHGVEDEKVPIEIGRQAKTCLGLLGADVEMVQYEGLEHWYSKSMLADIFAFLRERLM